MEGQARENTKKKNAKNGTVFSIRQSRPFWEGRQFVDLCGVLRDEGLFEPCPSLPAVE